MYERWRRADGDGGGHREAKAGDSGHLVFAADPAEPRLPWGGASAGDSLTNR